MTTEIIATEEISAEPLTTYWLYYCGEPLTAVRLPIGSSDDDVRGSAIDWHRRVPLCEQGLAPRTMEWCMLVSEVRHFPTPAVRGH